MSSCDFPMCIKTPHCSGARTPNTFFTGRGPCLSIVNNSNSIALDSKSDLSSNRRRSLSQGPVVSSLSFDICSGFTTDLAISTVVSSSFAPSPNFGPCIAWEMGFVPLLPSGSCLLQVHMFSSFPFDRGTGGATGMFISAFMSSASAASSTFSSGVSLEIFIISLFPWESCLLRVSSFSFGMVPGFATGMANLIVRSLSFGPCTPCEIFLATLLVGTWQ